MTLHICGRCGQLVQRSDRRCSQCGRLYPALFGMRRRLDEMFSRDVSWSKGLVLFLVVVYLASVVATQFLRDPVGPSAMERLSPGQLALVFGGAVDPWLVKHEGQWWRCVLANFLHLSPIHLLFNCWSLLAFGAIVERLFGPARFVTVFVVAGAFGFVVSALFDVATAGASSGICALLGATFGYGWKRKGNVGAEIRQEALRWMIYTAVFGIFVARVNNYAHAGGAIAGCLISFTFSLRQTGGGRESDAARLVAVASLIGFVLAVGAAVVSGFAMVSAASGR